MQKINLSVGKLSFTKETVVNLSSAGMIAGAGFDQNWRFPAGTPHNPPMSGGICRTVIGCVTGKCDPNRNSHPCCDGV